MPENKYLLCKDLGQCSILRSVSMRCGYSCPTADINDNRLHSSSKQTDVIVQLATEDICLHSTNHSHKQLPMIMTCKIDVHHLRHH